MFFCHFFHPFLIKIPRNSCVIPRYLNWVSPNSFDDATIDLKHILYHIKKQFNYFFCLIYFICFYIITVSNEFFISPFAFRWCFSYKHHFLFFLQLHNPCNLRFFIYTDSNQTPQKPQLRT